MLGTVYRGDSWEINIQITDSEGQVFDVSNWEIRAEISYVIGSNKTSIKKANNLVNGGSVNQIKVLDNQGNIEIIVEKEETMNLEAGEHIVEVEITSSQGKRYTVVRDLLQVKHDIITWQEPS